MWQDVERLGQNEISFARSASKVADPDFALLRVGIGVCGCNSERAGRTPRWFPQMGPHSSDYVMLGSTKREQGRLCRVLYCYRKTRVHEYVA